MKNILSSNDYPQIHKRDWLTLLVILIVLVLLPPLVSRLPPQLATFPESWNLGLRQPIDDFQNWVIGHRNNHPLFVYFFDPLSQAIDLGIRQIETVLLGLPWPLMLLVAFLLGQWAGGLRLALFAVAGFLFMALVGLWTQSMQTLALMSVSVFISLAIAIPLGIVAARYPKFDTAMRPLLDAMQTMPAFVYLIPVLLFFGIARVPSVIATVIYALPPAIRLTTLGIRRVSPAALEAAHSFGSTPWQILLKVQLPLALPTLMAGVNQTIMMALGIVVIAALIGAGGLGREVLVSLQRLQVGNGLEAGLAIVFMAIILDRISQGFSNQNYSLLAQQSQGFVLFPNGWYRFGLIRALEQGLHWLLSGGYRLAQMVTAAWVGLINIGVKAPLHREAVAEFGRRHAFFSGSLLLLALLLFVPFGPFPAAWSLDLSRPVDAAVNWMRDNLYQIGDLPIGTGPFSDFITLYTLNPLRSLFQKWLPWPLLMVALAWLGYRVSSWGLALFAGLGLFFIGLLGMWEHSMDTLSQVVVAVTLTLVIALPVGILSARHDMFATLLRPVLDTLQTIPPFVYLVPVIMLFNVGRVPGIIASVLYALPPGIRLTELGLRQVSPQTLEAARAFGSSARQTLTKVQFPLALPSIMVGINQVVMMVLSMVIIAGLVGGGGLGLETVTGLAKNQTGRGLEAGLAIVIMAMILDRLTQALAQRQRYPLPHQ